MQRCVLPFLFLLSSCGKIPPGVSERTFQFGQTQRRYLVHSPANAKSAMSIVLVFHGAGGRPEGAVKLTKMNEVSDENGFLAVYPEGVGKSFNGGTCCGTAQSENIDDVGFVKSLLDELPKFHDVDTKRVYATGISNGAIFVYRLAAELADRITAIAPVAGDMGVTGPQPSRAVPVIAFHGLKDPVVPYNGGRGPGGVDHRAIRASLKFWVDANRCRLDPNAETTTDYTLEKCDGPAPVQLYTLPNGGHTWPGGVDVTSGLGTGPLVESVDASRLMWRFFSPFRLP